MKKITSILALAVIATITFTGCLTSKVSTVTPGGTNAVTGATFAPVTNTVTVVNTNNLILDAGLLQGGVAMAVSVAVQKDPNCIDPLKQAQTVLDGILNGANTNTTGQVLTALGNNSNPVLAAEIKPLIGTLSSLEQQLLYKYGAETAGQISIALSKAVLGGITIGLAGQ